MAFLSLNWRIPLTFFYSRTNCVEAMKLLGTGKRHMVMQDFLAAVNAFQDACRLLSTKHGEMANECGEAYFCYGKALLELARMESGVLGNALEGVPEEDDDDDEEEDNDDEEATAAPAKDSKIESAGHMNEKERDELREQVYAALAEESKPAESEVASKADGDQGGKEEKVDPMEMSNTDKDEEVKCPTNKESPDQNEMKTIDQNDAGQMKGKGDGLQEEEDSSKEIKKGILQEEDTDCKEQVGAGKEATVDLPVEKDDDEEQKDSTKEAKADAEAGKQATEEVQPMEKVEGEKDEAMEETVQIDAGKKATVESQPIEKQAEDSTKVEIVQNDDSNKIAEKDHPMEETGDIKPAEAAKEESVQISAAKLTTGEDHPLEKGDTIVDQVPPVERTAPAMVDADVAGKSELEGKAISDGVKPGKDEEKTAIPVKIEESDKKSVTDEMKNEGEKESQNIVKEEVLKEAQEPIEDTFEKSHTDDQEEEQANPEEPMEEGEDASCATEGSEDEKEEAPVEKDAESEEVDNLQLAWEMLELANVIFKRQETKEAQLYAAQAYLKLGEVGIESENYIQSIEDFTECLNIQEKHLAPHSRLLAETHYQLGLAYSFNNQYDLSVKNFKQSFSVIEKRLAMLTERIEKMEEKGKSPAKDTDAVNEDKREIEELKELLPEIKAKIEDAEESKSDGKATKEALKATLSGAPASSGFASGSNLSSAPAIAIPVRKASDEASTSSSSTAASNCVSNISHLVRKKFTLQRKPEEDGERVDNEPKKPKQEESTVNGGCGDAAHSRNGMSVEMVADDTVTPKKSETTAQSAS
eukprot:gi/632963785/ref/XP_007898079.1/ PREDICTED: nuclear autoantigenic sperm protein isoform X1 [Callorhinchus milii]